MSGFDDEMMEMPENDENEEFDSFKSGTKISFIKVGIPILVVQIILAYFLATNVLVPQLYGDATADGGDRNTNDGSLTNEKQNKKEQFGKIYTIEDIIVNPAESRGMQFVLVNFGFEVKEDSDLKILEKREIQIRDILIKTMSSKTLPELDGPKDKEKLRLDVMAALEDLFPKNHLMNIYFSNYIIQ